MSPTRLEFNVEPQCDTYSQVLIVLLYTVTFIAFCVSVTRGVHSPQQNVELKAVGEDSVCWRAVTGDCVHWWCDCSVMSGPAQSTKDQQLCVVSPSSGALRPGQTVGLVVSVNPAVVIPGEKYLEVIHLQLIFALFLLNLLNLNL